MRSSDVERVVRVVQILPVPQSDATVLGVINIHGNLCSVLDLRRLFNHEVGEIQVTDHIVITNGNQKSTGFLVEKITGISEREESDLVALETILPGRSIVSGLSAFQDGVLFISDPEACISQLAQTLAKSRSIE